MKSITFKIKGTRDLLMHNIQLADPTNQYAKAIKSVTSKRKKTDDDHIKMWQLEFNGSLYLDADGEPCLTDRMLEAGMVEAAKIEKRRKDAQSGIMVTEPTVKLAFDGPKDPDEMYEKGFFLRCAARVQSGRVLRTRPLIPRGWQATFTAEYDEEVVDRDSILGFMENLGGRVGLGDWRPKFGRFEVMSAK